MRNPGHAPSWHLDKKAQSRRTSSTDRHYCPRASLSRFAGWHGAGRACGVPVNVGVHAVGVVGLPALLVQQREAPVAD